VNEDELRAARKKGPIKCLNQKMRLPQDMRRKRWKEYFVRLRRLESDIEIIGRSPHAAQVEANACVSRLLSQRNQTDPTMSSMMKHIGTIHHPGRKRGRGRIRHTPIR
jgi:hypothetical protein